jgi:hypothetical protein
MTWDYQNKVVNEEPVGLVDSEEELETWTVPTLLAFTERKFKYQGSQMEKMCPFYLTSPVIFPN